MGGNALVPPAGQVILQKGIWFKVIEWKGFPVVPITHVITTQTEYRGWDIEWRRYGVAWAPYWQGTFKEQESFTVYPGELFLRVDLRSPEFDLGINIERESSDK